MTQESPRKSTLIAPALIIILGPILAALIISQTWLKVSNRNATITVTGSAKKSIVSDMIVWEARFSRNAKTMNDAYNALQKDQEKVKAYLAKKGIPEKDIVFQSINTRKFFAYSNGMETSQVTGYELSQNFKVTSTEVDKISKISRESTELINESVEFESYGAQFMYTKLADLKILILADATRDAKARAEQIAENSGSKIGSVRNARMGVLQITPKNSTEVSDYGYNDVSSLEKDVTAVVSVSFEIK